MARNFGIVTGSTGVGGNHPSSPHCDADSTRVDSDFLPAASHSLRPPNSRADDFEIGAGFLSLVFVLSPLIVVGGLVVGYLTLAPKPVEYQRGVEAYRLKGH